MDAGLMDDGRMDDGLMDDAGEIVLTGVRAFGYHGVFEAERREGQEFIVDTTLSVDITRAAATDEVADTVHYGEVAERIVDIVSGEPLNLIETLAARIADDLLTRPHVQAVAVTVHKPSAPITVPFADVAVTVRRKRRPDRAEEVRS